MSALNSCQWLTGAVFISSETLLVHMPCRAGGGVIAA